MVDFSEALGFSEDSADVFVGLFELDYKKTGNPMCVWNAILRMNEVEITCYPTWVREYLVQSARNLKTCEPTPKGQYGIVAAFGLKGNLLYEEDIELVIRVDRMMREKIRNGMGVEEAADATEIELYDRGEESLIQDELKPKQRGYFGSSRIQKIYRELRKAENGE